MVRFREESAGIILEGRGARPLATSVAFQERSFQRFQRAYQGAKKFGGDFRRGTFTTLGDMSDGTNTLSLYGVVGSVALFVTGVGARLFNIEDATNFFSEIAIATGTVGGFLSVSTAFVTDSLTRNLREMARR